MKSLIVSVFAVVTAANIFVIAQGLECYNCWAVDNLPTEYYQPIEGIQGDPSCRKGFQPAEGLKGVCPPLEIDGNEIPTVCTQLSVTTVIPLPGLPIPPGTTVTGTLRGCFHYDATVEDLAAKPEGCSKKNFQQLEDLSLGPFKQALEEIRGITPIPIPSTLTGDLCHCKTDNCNSYDECAGENPPEWCKTTTAKPPGDSSSPSTSPATTTCTGDNCDTAPSLQGTVLLFLALATLGLIL